MFSLKSVVVGLTALAVPALCQTADQQAANYNDLSDKSAALIPEVNKVAATDAALFAAGQGQFPIINQGLAEIVTTGNTYVRQQQNAAPVAAGAESDTVVDAFSAFVKQHTDLMSALAEKAGLFTVAPFVGGPIVQVLILDERVLDSLVFQTINLVPSRSDEISNLGDSLSSAVRTAKTAYEGLQLGGTLVGRRNSEGRVAQVMVA
ncbi:hypothetical protein CERZMDRAFT_101147 [Cercospora zeae-maydis SCOH1-5]|uniref:Uncharacterized protein n=1 Tax=Cercospora zeae-maydis SCOH1-5 TaxID=717836 RepID=A0A6A6F462_9PEZI|nr:hypothetical protein CERZMDRAFT_101147 [Cercospora zeae-maydis SCOH1-5]